MNKCNKKCNNINKLIHFYVGICKYLLPSVNFFLIICSNTFHYEFTDSIYLYILYIIY